VYTAAPWTDGLSEIPPAIPLSEEAAKAVADIKAPSRLSRRPAKSPRAFSQDMQSTPDRGEDYALRTIVQGPFSKWDWPKSREELLRFLALPHNDQTEARARFYLGQVYYFSGLPRDALFEFLFIQSSYPWESAEWVGAVLNLLADQK
jgi:TolA-binding protein